MLPSLPATDPTHETLSLLVWAFIALAAVAVMIAILWAVSLLRSPYRGARRERPRSGAGFGSLP